jgi:antirestriction protein ArdC
MIMDIYEQVTANIVKALEAGSAPWLKPWSGKGGSGFEPYNGSSGRPYNGINLLILGCLPYADNAFLTYKQAKALGGNVRKGEKGCMVIFWQFNRLTDSNGDAKTVPFAKAYTVFNVEQCEGIATDSLKRPAPIVAGSTAVNDLAASHGAQVFHGGDKACFIPSQDKILMPSAADFKSLGHYQSTLAHELVHWSGHDSRLKRDFSGRFGSEAYAFEELVAEIGSAFVCAQLGLALDGLQHSDYLASWLKVLKADKRAIFTAASKAKQAAGFLLGDKQAVAESQAA